MLLGSIFLFKYLAFSRFKSLVLKRQIIDLSIDLNRKLLHFLGNDGVGFLEKLHFMPLMNAVNHTLWTDRLCATIKAEVLDFLFRMFLAEITNLNLAI